MQQRRHTPLLPPGPHPLQSRSSVGASVCVLWWCLLRLGRHQVLAAIIHALRRLARGAALGRTGTCRLVVLVDTVRLATPLETTQAPSDAEPSAASSSVGSSSSSSQGGSLEGSGGRGICDTSRPWRSLSKALTEEDPVCVTSSSSSWEAPRLRSRRPCVSQAAWGGPGR